MIVKPTNSPTQGQSNPRKIRFKVTFGATFSHSKYFFVGWEWFYVGNKSTRNPNPTKFPAKKHPISPTQLWSKI